MKQFEVLFSRNFHFIGSVLHSLFEGKIVSKKKNWVFAIESVSIFSLANAELFFFWSVLMSMFVLMNSHSSIDITLYVNLFSKIDFEGNAARLPFCLFLLFLMEIWLWRIKDWLWEAKLNEAFSAGNCEMIFSFFLLFSAKKTSYYFLFSPSSTPFKGMSIKINITKTMAAIFSMKEKRWIPKVIGSFFWSPA